MGGFCRRCGDIIHDARCSKCGGSSVASNFSKALFEPASGAGKPDRWLKTYAGGRTFNPHALAGTPVETPPKPSTPVQTVSAPLFDPPQIPSAPASPSKRLERGKSVKASAQAHVRSLTSDIPDNIDLSPAEEAVLSNVFGSCLDPHESRGKCGMCREMFRRDMKIYPDPRRDDGGGFENIFYCRPCYAKSFARGKCGRCGKDVVGDEHFISLGKGGSRGVWHKPCFRCTHCDTDISGQPSVGFQGEPCCEACFDRGGRGPDEDTASPAIDIPDLRTGQRRLTKSQDAIAMKPAVDELRKRLRSAGMETDIRPAAKKAASTPPASIIASAPSHAGKEKPLPTAPLSPQKEQARATRPLHIKKSSWGPTRPPLGQTSLAPHPPATPPRAISPAANPLCAACQLPLFRSKVLGGGSVGEIVTIPATKISYHLECLRCDGCGGHLGERFVDVDGKRICTGCIKKEEDKEREEREQRKREMAAGRAMPATVPWKPSQATNAASAPNRASLRQSFPAPAPAPVTPSKTNNVPVTPTTRGPLSPRIASSPFFTAAAGDTPQGASLRGSPFLAGLGGQACCPGCGRQGTLTETKLGPGGNRWHVGCLRCFGCRKQLDSGARKTADGKVGCRNCLDQYKVASAPGSPAMSYSGRLASVV